MLTSRPTPVDYGEGTVVAGRAGLSILDVSRLGHVPHAQVCSGRGRCGTCLVAVDGDGALTPVGDVEAATLTRLHAPAGTRLACQARLLGEPVGVRRLQPSYADVEDARDPLDLDGRWEPADGTVR
ncbi:(2Fe-2S)-binding protein [Lichenibacterium minor]|uniref:(2Fe-2S)-binding protein n=1 Tax=Lichenibacterium minor TaxID=2316528 RepID=A0A4Q2U1V8_9HYPH|nr:2Fe-2S iron-sulfur cluster-binding protein [Lichenibacterium minor]RYC28817.1 (2Fe-2S)-binding protein [Lichenibacterium minor]